jgi:glyoxylase-like metal-dependent hydrolase (beta-lactamase superfamily II)
MPAPDTDGRAEIRLHPGGAWDARIQVCHLGDLVDAYIVTTRRYVVLIDTFINPPTAEALWSLAEPHLGAHRALVVVNTHADWDHCWGNSVFAGPAARHPAPVLGHRLGAERTRAPATARELAEMQLRQPHRFGDVLPTAPTVLFDERLVLDGGDLTIELIATPGHQPDHIAVWVPEIRTLLAGDAAEQPFPLVTAPADLPVLRRSLARLAALEPVVALYCHAPVTAGPALLAHNRGYFDRLEARCAAALAHGLTPADARADGADPAALVGFPFTDTLPPGVDATDVSASYREQHRDHIGFMLAWLAGAGWPAEGAATGPAA